MKKNIFFVLLIVFSLGLNAQIININPDPNGEPWIVGGLRVLSQSEMDKIPLLKLDASKSAKDLPSSLDNSSQPYFRQVFYQTGGCCAQASGVGYNFTYEMNFARGTNANTSSTNRYPTHFTYNFLNGGSEENGSNYTDGWNIIKASGCPTEAAYGGLTHSSSDTYWMSGYDSYRNAMDNKCVEYFAINVSTPEGVETLKYWMKDHLQGDAAGGLANFSAGVYDAFSMNGENIIYRWGEVVNHAMTFIGWDDDIEYDFNNDGNITNDIDINGDLQVDMCDWEKGALIMVNSWGTTWGNSGKAYVMYKLLAEPVSNGGISGGKVFVIKVRPSYTPKLLMKVKMAHSSRNMLKITAGYSTSISSTEPEYILDLPLFNYQGGNNPMNGSSPDALEFTIDATPLLSFINSGSNAHLSINITEKDPLSSGLGAVADFSIIAPSGEETVCLQHNVLIENNTTTRLYIDAVCTFDSPEIITSALNTAHEGELFTQNMEATGGSEPYKWTLKLDYLQTDLTSTFPSITSLQLTPTDNDDGQAELNLDFDFPFYGKKYNKIWISTDGSLVFEEGFNYLRSESAIISNKMIAVFASDLMIYPDDNDGIFYSGDASGATIRWKTSLYDQQDANIDVAVKIFPSGEIQYFYGSGITAGLDWASGISAGDELNYNISTNSGNNNPSNAMFKFSASEFPIGMELSEDGIFSGTPSINDTWELTFAVTDFDKITKTKSLQFSSYPLSINNISDKSTISIYPNPASEIVSIQINFGSTKKISVDIFDATGRKIKHISSGLISGTQILNWNCTNESEKRVQEGVYFIQISNSENVVSRKVLIIN